MKPRAIALVHREDDLPLVRAGVALGDTVVVSVAPDTSGWMERARALGAVRSVRLWDDALAATDYLGIAYTLAAAVRVLGADGQAPPVVLAGDADRASVGPAVAERLGMPHLGNVVGATVEDGKIVAQRRTRGVVRRFAGAAPCVLCLLTHELEPVHVNAAAGEEETWTLSRIGLTAAELSYRRRFKPVPSPGPPHAPRVFDNVAALAERLRADGLIMTGKK